MSTLESLSLDGTSIISLESDSIPSSLHHLSLVSTPLQYLDLPPLPHLRSIDLSHTKLKSIPHLNTPLLQTFTMNANQILVSFIFTRLFIMRSNWNSNGCCWLQHCDILSLSSLSSLTNLSLEESTQMRSIYGHLPSSIQSFSLTHSLLTSLHPLFFRYTLLLMSKMKDVLFLRSSPSFLNISHNDWSCSSCFLQWTLPLKEKHHFFLPNCTPPQGKKDCTTLEVWLVQYIFYGCHTRRSKNNK